MATRLSMAGRARRMARRLAYVFFVSGLVFAAVGFNLTPPEFNDRIARDPFFVLFPPLVLFPLGLVSGAYFLAISLRGFDDVTITQAGLVVPRRSLSDLLRNRPSVIPLDQIIEFSRRDRRGHSVLEVRFKLPNGRTRRLRLLGDWIPDSPAVEAEYERLTGRRIG